MVLTAYSALFPATNSSVTVADGLRSCQTRLGRHRLRRFDASNGRQNHTALPYADRFRQRELSGMSTPPRPKRNRKQRRSSTRRPNAHEPKGRPAFALRDDAAASTASHPNVRDDRDTPLSRDGTAWDKPVIWVKWKWEYFCRGGLDREIADLPRRARTIDRQCPLYVLRRGDGRKQLESPCYARCQFGCSIVQRGSWGLLAFSTDFRSTVLGQS
jgi:hypothetical protein